MTFVAVGDEGAVVGIQDSPGGVGKQDDIDGVTAEIVEAIRHGEFDALLS